MRREKVTDASRQTGDSSEEAAGGRKGLRDEIRARRKGAIERKMNERAR